LELSFIKPKDAIGLWHDTFVANFTGITLTGVCSFRLAFAIIYSSVTGFFDHEKLLDFFFFDDIKIK
jgi:hypothetical protein